MTHSTIRLSTTPEDHRVARLAAAAVALSLIDAAIPMPLPGIKPGLANIITLIVLARHGWGTAAWVCALRVIAGGLLLGQFLSPGFFMSLTGAAFSLIVLAPAARLPQRWFGPVPDSGFCTAAAPEACIKCDHADHASCRPFCRAPIHEGANARPGQQAP